VLWVLVASLPIGALIGMVGIGGLLLPALLGQATGDPHLAAGTSSFAFLFTGVVALIGLARSGGLERRNAVPLTLGAAPGALLGSFGAGLLPGWVMVVLLALVCLGSGVHNLASARGPGDRLTLTVPAMLIVSFLVGAASAVTGTGGPVLLVPVLLALRVEVRVAIGLALFSQVPIVWFAVLGYAVNGDIDYGWGSAFGVIAAIGVLIGMRIATRWHPDRLRQLAAAVLVLTGVYLLGSVLV